MDRRKFAASASLGILVVFVISFVAGYVIVKMGIQRPNNIQEIFAEGLLMALIKIGVQLAFGVDFIFIVGVALSVYGIFSPEHASKIFMAVRKFWSS